MSAGPDAPSDEEVRAALDVLRRAGWEFQVGQGFGALDGEFLVPAYAAQGDHVRTYRARVMREPWKEVVAR